MVLIKEGFLHTSLASGLMKYPSFIIRNYIYEFIIQFEIHYTGTKNILASPSIYQKFLLQSQPLYS